MSAAGIGGSSPHYSAQIIEVLDGIPIIASVDEKEDDHEARPTTPMRAHSPARRSPSPLSLADRASPILESEATPPTRARSVSVCAAHPIRSAAAALDDRRRSQTPHRTSRRMLPDEPIERAPALSPSIQPDRSRSSQNSSPASRSASATPKSSPVRRTAAAPFPEHSPSASPFKGARTPKRLMRVLFSPADLSSSPMGPLFIDQRDDGLMKPIPNSPNLKPKAPLIAESPILKGLGNRAVAADRLGEQVERHPQAAAAAAAAALPANPPEDNLVFLVNLEDSPKPDIFEPRGPDNS
jgi:hypothetical protein